MRVISFNSTATSAINGKSGAKLRMDVKDGTLCIRPTDRKAGPHTLSEMAKGKDGVAVEITDKQLEKLGASNLLAEGAKFTLVEDKYGWFALKTGDDLGEKAVKDSVASVTVKDEPAPEVKEEKAEKPAKAEKADNGAEADAA
jgi:hypothetical protein